MKWNTIKLLCEYSDDFSKEDYKDVVDGLEHIDDEGLSELQSQFRDFVEQWDRFENTIFVDGYQGQIQTRDVLTKDKMEAHGLSKHAVGIFMTGVLTRLREFFEKQHTFISRLNNKARRIFDELRQTIDYTFSICKQVGSFDLWSDHPNFVKSIDKIVDLSRTLQTIDLPDDANDQDTKVYENLLHEFSKYISAYTMERMHDIMHTTKNTATDNGYTFKLDNHWFFYKSVVVNNYQEILNIRMKLQRDIERMRPHNIAEHLPAFDPNNPPQLILDRVHAIESYIVELAELLDLM